MTKQQLAERYKEIEIKQITDILEVNLWKDKTHPFEQRVKILFAYDKLYFIGNFEFFVFGEYVSDIKTVFQGNEINPYDWIKKCEISNEVLLSEQTDLKKCKSKVVDYIWEHLETERKELSDLELQDYDENVHREIDNTFYHIENYNYCSHAIYQIADLLKTLKIDDYEAEHEAWSIVNEYRFFSEYYLYACETIQWVENNLDKWKEQQSVALEA